MNTLSALVKGNLSKNKSKNILVIITIILTTVLLTSVALICFDWIEGNKQRTIEYAGSFHGIYKRSTVDELKIIENNLDIESFGVIRTIGYADKNENQLSVAYVDENAMNMNSVRFLKGSMPIKENEIAIQDGYLKLLGIKAEVGEKITLEYESRENEEIIKEDFIISGIMETSEANLANKKYSAMISKEFLNKKANSKDMVFTTYVRVKGEDKLSGTELKEKIKAVAGDIGIEEYRVKVNEDYINASNPDPSVIGGGIVVALIVVFSSMLVIYSIFYVSIINKVQEYGKLRAIGATKKQIKRIIFREGFILATISIPIGVILGYLLCDLIIIKLIQLNKYNIGRFNLPIIIGIVIISYLTVFMSLIKPMKIASKVSPIEAIRYTGGNKGKNNRRGYEEITLNKLTFANLSRNKKRTFITLASLALSGILFITVSSLLYSIDAKKMATMHSLGDITLSLSNYKFEAEMTNDMTLGKLHDNNPLGEELRNKIKDIPGVKEVNKSLGTSAKHINSASGEEIVVSFGEYKEDYFKEIEENLVEGEVNKERLLSGEGIIYGYPDFAKENGVKVGEKIKLKIMDGTDYVEKEFTVDAISAVYGDEFLIPKSLREKILKKDLTNAVGVVVEKDKIKSVEETLKTMVESNGFIKISTLEEQIKLNEKSLEATKVLGYSLVIIIGVIGFMNLINTMITSILARKKELGVLQAIGLSDKQLIKMLQIEGLFYTVGTLVATLTIGNIIGYVSVIMFKNSGASYATYSYPVIPTIILIVAITLVQILITYLVANNFKKDSLVDRIRYNE